MWFGDVDVPGAVVEAHRNGELVLFVGAGASRDAPSSLPDFKELAQRIATDAAFDGDEIRDLDTLLGLIEDSGVDVHRRVRDLLGTPASSPNRLHEAIVDLALAGGIPRIVTTNFDLHLSSIVEDHEASLDRYVAPALPMGNDFAGLVYLHGNLDQPADQLVVTDKDFGGAYLRDAWAARFLERMFARFKVLFIGYSHQDVTMRYFARSLGPDGSRFVLTSDPASAAWRRLGLTPIGYPVDADSHGALGKALARWASDTQLALLGHRSRVTELVRAEPSGIPEETSYLEETIADPVRVTFFTHAAATPGWLAWAASQPVFKSLFVAGPSIEPGSPSSEIRRALAGWFVRHFVLDEDTADVALQIVFSNGGHLGEELCDSLGFEFAQRDHPRPEWLWIWLVLLVRDSPPSCFHWLEAALRASRWPEHREHVLLLFDHLTRPEASLERSFSSRGPLVGVGVRGQDYALEEAWNEIVKPNLDDAAEEVVRIADRNLGRAAALRAAGGRSSPDFDPLSYARSAIEPHPQDRHTTGIDVLIDAARESLDALLDAGSPIAPHYLMSWESAESPILRRLAIHAWDHRSDIDTSAKIDWLVSSGLLFNHQLRHEVFRLIANALPDVAGETIERLLDATTKSVVDGAEGPSYKQLNLLAWMNSYRPNHPGIETALAAAREVDPDWTATEHPDLDHYMEVGWVPSRPPMSIEEFRLRLAGDAQELLADLQGTKAGRLWSEQPTWDDALDLVRTAVASDPSDGFLLLDAQQIDTDIVGAVIAGWSRATLDDAQALRILQRIGELDLAAVAPGVAWMLASGGRYDGYPTEWFAYPEARSIALEIWTQLPDGEAPQAQADWLHYAINDPGGQIAEFWMEAIGHDWASDEESWVGLRDDHRHAAETMLSDEDPGASRQNAQVIIASRFNFLFAADPSWAIDHLLPLFSWADPARAVRTWGVFTGWSRWNDRMLDVGLMDGFLATVLHLDEFPEESCRSVLGQLAGIALTSWRDPSGWLPGVIAQLSDDDRVVFANAIAEVLDDLPEDAVEHQWDRWIETYWKNRLGSVPVALSTDEATAMAEWVPALASSFAAGVGLATEHAAGFREHSNILRRMEARVDSAPDACCRLIAHLLKGTDPPWWGGHTLEALMPRLKAGSSSESIEALAEEALRFGFDFGP